MWIFMLHVICCPAKLSVLIKTENHQISWALSVPALCIGLGGFRKDFVVSGTESSMLILHLRACRWLVAFVCGFWFSFEWSMCELQFYSVKSRLTLFHGASSLSTWNSRHDPHDWSHMLQPSLGFYVMLCLGCCYYQYASYLVEDTLLLPFYQNRVKEHKWSCMYCPSPVEKLCYLKWGNVGWVLCLLDF